MAEHSIEDRHNFSWPYLQYCDSCYCLHTAQYVCGPGSPICGIGHSRWTHEHASPLSIPKHPSCWTWGTVVKWFVRFLLYWSESTIRTFYSASMRNMTALEATVRLLQMERESFKSVKQLDSPRQWSITRRPKSISSTCMLCTMHTCSEKLSPAV